jgi:hypothetical protein
MSSAKSSPELNRVAEFDRPIHDWYRFVLSFPPHLVRDYLNKFEVSQTQTVLDPFCGTGTTVVECKKNGVPSVGIEANPMAYFACRTKTDWAIDPRKLLASAEKVAEHVNNQLELQGLVEQSLFATRNSFARNSSRSVELLALPPEQEKLILANSISPIPLHKTLMLRDAIETLASPRLKAHLRLALAKATVFSASNLHFGPEVGVKKPKKDAPVVSGWLDQVENIARDLESWNEGDAIAQVHHADARDAAKIIAPNSIDTVITSPPYPNEKDYTRTTRLESVLLGFLTDKASLRALKKGMLRSNTRGVYKEDTDDQWVADHAEIQRIASEIEARRIELGKTSGFERMYHRVTKLYFGGMKRHFSELRTILRPGAKLAYVVGDQASFLRVMIRTGNILADLAESLGYRVLGIDLFRTRIATATREQLREEVVLLEWPGNPKNTPNSRKAKNSKS